MRLPQTFNDWLKSLVKYFLGFVVIRLLLEPSLLEPAFVVKPTYYLVRITGIVLVLVVLFPNLKKYLPNLLSGLNQKWLIITLSAIIVLGLIVKI